MSRACQLAPLLLGALPACLSRPAAPDWEALRGELAARVAQDQELRQQLFSGESLDPEVAHRLERVDLENTARMKAIVDAHGWPDASRLGEQGAHHAWLLVQHADQDVEFQERCLVLLRAAVEQGQASARDLAYLEDRVAMHRGRPQRYGTQFVSGADGELRPHPIEDEAHVDERRAAIGLPPLAGYAERLRAGQ
jgi:hypothetical protein